MSSDMRDAVKEKYGEAALRVLSDGSSCCGSTPGCCSEDPITSRLYNEAQAGQIPEEALKASLGCGNPTAFARLQPGDTVLDPGSGGRIDVLLSAGRVGPTGKAYGLDMTDEMLVLARENQKKAGVENVEFLKGEIEHIPLPDIAGLSAAWFENIDVEPARIYRIDDPRTFLEGQNIDVDAIAHEIDGKFMSAFVRATKPKGCCEPGCCSSTL